MTTTHAPRSNTAGRPSSFRVSTGWLSMGLVLAIGASSLAAWDGVQEIALGDTTNAEFAAGGDTSVHVFKFYAPNGTGLNATFKTTGDLVPGIRLFDAAGTEIPLGATLNGLKIKKYVFPASGEYSLRINAASGSGTYSMKTKAKFISKLTLTDASGNFNFAATAGSTFNASVKAAKGSDAVPTFDSLDGPFGPVGFGTPAAKLKKVMLPFDGGYDLGWANSGADGDAVAKIKIKFAKSKRVYGFDVVETTPGVVSQQRADWLGSAHADATAEAFTHWNEDGEIPTNCARCHSTPGYRDYVGADGTAQFVVDNPAPLGTVVNCDACHNEATEDLTEVFFPSGAHVTMLGSEARCMTCHQGRESGVDLEEHIGMAGIVDDDTSNTNLSFQNIHYFAAGATLYGGQVNGAYQYEGKFYDGLSMHVDGYQTCTECHNPHTLEVKFDECSTCHPGVTDGDSARGTIRMARSVRDYDADGDLEEGIANELQTMADILYRTMQDYAANVNGEGIVYDSHAYPYYFKDTNDNGMVDPGEAIFPNAYKPWTARLLRAAYNYQYFQKDPGSFAHNRKYMIEILYDSIENLAEHAMIDVPELPMMWRNDTGHFDTTAEAYRHWDQEADDIEEGSIDRGSVSSSCARCHSPEGFDFWAEYGIDITRSTEVADGLNCETCHTDFASNPLDPPRKFIAEVEFPGGALVLNDTMNQNDSLICMSCHKGREGSGTVDEYTAGKGVMDPDEIDTTMSFRNPHYFAAGATVYGADAGVYYEPLGMAGNYERLWDHGGNAARAECAFCHLDDHTFEPQFDQGNCGGCHSEVTDGNIESIRKDRDTDYDGDGNDTELLKDEVASYGDGVLAAMQAYCRADAARKSIGLNVDAYPYFFVDDNDNGVIDEGETTRYNTWTPRLLKAALNHQLWRTEPGAWAHNTHYVMQVLYDTIDDLGGDLGTLTRPDSD